MNFIDKLTAQLPFGKKSVTPEYFFALNIGLSEVTAVVWSLSNNQLDILGDATLSYKGTDDLLDKSYKVLDESLGALEIEPQKILFGVPESWGTEDNLKEPYLKLLRRLLKESDLSPMAYVTTNNAIAHSIQKKEGVPQTAILLGLGDFLEITLLRGGKVVDTRSCERSDHLFDDVEKILRQFTDVEVLPSKILLFPIKTGENLSKIKDSLMSYPWMQKLSFLHFPKIEILDDDVAIKAIVLAGAVELNPDVDLKHSFLVQPGHKKQLLQEIEEKNIKDFGFVKGDIKEETKEPKELEEEKLEAEQDKKDDVLISPEHPPSPFGGTTRLIKKPHLENQQTVYVEHNVVPASRSDVPDWHTLEKTIESQAKNILPKKFKIPKIPLGKFLILPLVLVLIAAAYIFFVKAEVTVYVEPKIMEKDADIIADPKSAAVDEEKKIIPGSVVETTVTGSRKATASGQKQIGDPAKGKVIIYNRTDAKVSFSKGTVLSSDSGLKFSLDTSVQIASQSSSLGAGYKEIIEPGKSDSVGITASVIGPESNLPGNSELSLGNYPKAQVVAQADEALSGGTSKNVTVVTADDQKKLQAQVIDDLRQKAEKELQDKLAGEKKIISEALSVVDGKYTFNKQVNDQASEFSLSATVHFKGTSYSDADLRTIVAKLVETNIPEGFTMNLQDSETQADVSKVEKDGTLVFKAKFKAKLLPKLNLDDLKKQIRGKSVEEVAQTLKNLENVVGSEIKFTPKLPNQLTRLPLLGKNITIIVTPK